MLLFRMIIVYLCIYKCLYFNNKFKVLCWIKLIKLYIIMVLVCDDIFFVFKKNEKKKNNKIYI